MSELLAHDVDPAFAGYDQILAPINAGFPQRQGLLEPEYRDAVNDPNVKSTPVSDEQDRQIELPQLSPVEHNSWLKLDYYQGAFPDAFKDGAVRQYTDLPGVEPSQEVKDGLLDLAKNSGILVFDYPDNDPGYPGRVVALLENMGVRVQAPQVSIDEGKEMPEITENGKVVELGHQAYYTGQVHLKKGLDPTKPTMKLHEALKIVKHIKRPGEPETGAPSYAQIMEASDVLPMFEAYDEAFQAIANYPCRQGFTWEEFFEVATDEAESAKIVYNIDGEPSVICILGDDLSKYDWVNPDFFKSQFPDKFEEKQILYYPAIASKEKGGGNMAHLLGYLTQMLEQGNMEPVIAFDCCDKNIGMLNILLEAVINATPEVEISFDKKGTQTYAALQLYAA